MQSLEGRNTLAPRETCENAAEQLCARLQFFDGRPAFSSSHEGRAAVAWREQFASEGPPEARGAEFI